MLKSIIGRFRANEEVNCTKCIYSRLVSIGPEIREDMDLRMYRKFRLKPFYECTLKRKGNIGEGTVCIRFRRV